MLSHPNMNLQASLTEEDRRTFGFDMRGLHWPTYLDIYCQVSKSQNVTIIPSGNPRLCLPGLGRVPSCLQEEAQVAQPPRRHRQGVVINHHRQRLIIINHQ